MWRQACLEKKQKSSYDLYNQKNMVSNRARNDYFIKYALLVVSLLLLAGAPDLILINFKFQHDRRRRNRRLSIPL